MKFNWSAFICHMLIWIPLAALIIIPWMQVPNTPMEMVVVP